MTEHPQRLLHELLLERYPHHAELAQELTRPIPAVWVEDRRPYRKGGMGMTRWELRLLHQRACAR